jgi:uncharacterized phiE125 gp8 family phage protein
MALLLVTAPAVEPVTLTEAKLHLKVETADEDPLIDSLIAAARQTCELATGLALITQTWRHFLDAFPGGREEWWDGSRDGVRNMGAAIALEIPRPPLISITHVKTYDQADVAAIIPSGDCQVDTAARPGRVVMRAFAPWPAVTLRPVNGIEIEFQAGYGASQSAVPAQLRQGILQHVAHLYTHRGDLLDGNGNVAGISGLPPTVSVFYRPYRLMGL